MIIKGTVLGFSPVRSFVKNERNVQVQSICVDIPSSQYVGSRAFICNVYGESCGHFQLGDEVVCEVDRYATKVNSIQSVTSLFD